MAASEVDRVVVVLAGGEGRRMGGAKPSRVLAGRTLLSRAVGVAERQGGRVALSLAATHAVPSEAGERQLPILRDQDAFRGPLAGLAAALAWAWEEGASSVLTLPCDAPFLPASLGARLDQALRRSSAVAAAPEGGGRLQAACGLWRSDLGPALADYAATGRASLRGFWEAIGGVALAWPSHEDGAFFNINTPEDLAAAEQRLAAREQRSLTSG